MAQWKRHIGKVGILALATQLAGCDQLWTAFMRFTGLSSEYDSVCVYMMPPVVRSNTDQRQWWEPHQAMEFGEKFATVVKQTLKDEAKRREPLASQDGPERYTLLNPDVRRPAAYCGSREGLVDPQRVYRECIVEWGRILKNSRKESCSSGKPEYFVAGVEIKDYDHSAKIVVSAPLIGVDTGLGQINQSQNQQPVEVKIPRIDRPYDSSPEAFDDYLSRLAKETGKYIGLSLAERIEAQSR